MWKKSEKIMLLKWDLGWQSDVKCAAGKAHVDTKSNEVTKRKRTKKWIIAKCSGKKFRHKNSNSFNISIIADPKLLCFCV